MSRDLARGNVSGGVIIKPPISLCIWEIYSREMQLFCAFLIDIKAFSKNNNYFHFRKVRSPWKYFSNSWESFNFFVFSIIMWFICWTTQKFPAPSYWTCTEWLLTTPRRPNTKLICLLETRWKLLRRTRTVRRFEAGHLDPEVLHIWCEWERVWAVGFLLFRLVVLPDWLQTRLGSCILPGASGRSRGVRGGWTGLRRRAAQLADIRHMSVNLSGLVCFCRWAACHH